MKIVLFVQPGLDLPSDSTSRPAAKNGKLASNSAEPDDCFAPSLIVVAGEAETSWGQRTAAALRRKFPGAAIAYLPTSLPEAISPPQPPADDGWKLLAVVEKGDGEERLLSCNLVETKEGTRPVTAPGIGDILLEFQAPVVPEIPP